MAKAMQPQKMRFSQAIQTPMYKNLVNNTLGDPARGARFIANITSAVAVNPALQECNPGTILAGALLGESLLLQPSPQLGQFYLVPFKSKAKRDRQGNVIEPASVKAQFVLGYPQLRKTQKNQPARLMTPRKATGSGLDATVCLRPTWQQNFGICEKPGWKTLWWLLRWKKQCATKRSTHGAMLSACSIRRRRSMLQRLQSGKKLTSKIKEIGLTEKRRAETTF